MGRSIESVRKQIKVIAERWLRARKALKIEDQIYAEKLAYLAKKHSNEAFYAFDDPLEAVVFSVLIELMKKMEGGDDN